MIGLPEEPGSTGGGFSPTIERKDLDMPHLTAFRIRLRELRALSRSSFGQSGEGHDHLLSGTGVQHANGRKG